jgi:trimeric autotransporter adhesin
MSTTIKRIALVAVAALGLGVMTSAPSNAVGTTGYGTLIGDSTAGQQELNGFAQIVINYDDSITSVSTSGVGSIVSAVATGAAGAGQDTATVSAISGGTFTINDADAATDTGTVTVTLTSAVAGVQTLTMTPFTATGGVGTAYTKTVTWVTSLSKNTYTNSLVYLTGDTTTVPSVVSADTNTAASTSAAITVAATLNTTQSRAAVWVKQFATGDTTTVSTLASGKGKEVIVEITGAGSLGATASAATGSVVTLPASSSGSSAAQVYVFADGRTGPGTITVKVGGVLVATKSVAFTGTTSKYAVSTVTGEGLSKKYIGIGAGEAATVKFNGLDTLNNLAAVLPTLSNAITSDATIATAAVTAAGTITVTGVKAGKVMIYAANAATLATATIVSPAVEVEVTGTVAKTVTFSFDKSSYQPGEKITLSVNAVDANGRPVADGARAILKESATANMSLIGSLPGASVTLVDGKADYVIYAPSSSGDLIISGTEGTATASTTKAAIAGGTVSVTNGAIDAALDAANEAATAAQDATDAAIQAADAADEATAAVAALSLEVNTLIAGLKKQLVTLTNLVKNLQKAVAAKK